MYIPVYFLPTCLQDKHAAAWNHRRPWQVQKLTSLSIFEREFLLCKNVATARNHGHPCPLWYVEDFQQRHIVKHTFRKPFGNRRYRYKELAENKAQAYLWYVEHLFSAYDAVDIPYIFKRKLTFDKNPLSIGRKHADRCELTIGFDPAALFL